MNAFPTQAQYVPIFFATLQNKLREIDNTIQVIYTAKKNRFIIANSKNIDAKRLHSTINGRFYSYGKPVLLKKKDIEGNRIITMKKIVKDASGSPVTKSREPLQVLFASSLKQLESIEKSSSATEKKL
jgi:hypothetical protein